MALLLFFGLLAVYHANWTVLEEGDAVPSVNLPVTMLDHGRLSFSVADYPEMFKWVASPPFLPTDDFYFRRWHERFDEKTAAEWRQSGHLKFNGPRYYLVKSPERGVYVSTFGPVPGMVFFPTMAIVHAIDPLVGDKFLLKLSLAKLQGSLLIAGTALLLFGLATRFLPRWRSLLVAAIFGLATCAWAVSSQSLWQQTVNQFFLALGSFFLVRTSGNGRAAAGGLALGTAAACRPTGVIFLAAVVLFQATRDRRRALWCAVTAAVPLMLVGAYNQYYFGSPLSFAQELVGHQVALQKTGSDALWQTPL
jgi:hypothetical protein